MKWGGWKKTKMRGFQNQWVEKDRTNGQIISKDSSLGYFEPQNVELLSSRVFCSFLNTGLDAKVKSYQI